MSMYKFFLCAALGLGLTSCSLFHKAQPGFVGYAVATVDANSTPETRCYGYADKENERPYETNTVQNIGSVSKTFIGLSLMIAAEKGLIDLDAPIDEYLDFKVVNPHIGGDNPITLRHLATHTSGILDHKGYRDSYSKGKEPDMKLGAFLQAYLTASGSKYSSGNFAQTPSGTHYEYSNVAAALAAYVLESATGMPFYEFSRKYILEPIGMKNSGWFYREIDQSQHATLYSAREKPLKAYTLITYPDGGMRTTIDDLALYLQELIKGYQHNSALMSPASWDAFYKGNFTNGMQVTGIPVKEPDSGIFIFYRKGGLIGHTGGDPGIASFVFFDPESGKGRIFMTNEDINQKNVGEFQKIWKGLQ